MQEEKTGRGDEGEGRKGNDLNLNQGVGTSGKVASDFNAAAAAVRGRPGAVAAVGAPAAAAAVHGEQNDYGMVA